MNRRDLLKTAALAAAFPSAQSPSPNPQLPSPIKKAISIWAFPSGKPIREAMKQAKEAGFAGIEVAFAENGEINFDSTAEEMRRLARSIRSSAGSDEKEEDRTVH